MSSAELLWRCLLPFPEVTAGVPAASPALEIPPSFIVSATVPWNLSPIGDLCFSLSRCSAPHLKPLSPPQPHHPQQTFGVRDESMFPDTLLHSEPQTVCFSRNLGYKTSGRLSYHKRCIPLAQCMIQSLEVEIWKRNASSGM